MVSLPVLGVVLRAMRNYVLHQSANQAGSLAFSSVLAMFPIPTIFISTFIGVKLHQVVI